MENSELSQAEFERRIRRQEGLFTLKQCLAAGYSHKKVRNRLSDGIWKPVFRKVFALAGTSVGPSHLDRAAYMAVGEPVALAGLSAARRWRMWGEPSMPHLITPPFRHPELPGARIVRSNIPPYDRCLVDGLSITTRERTAIDVLLFLPPPGRKAFLDRALQNGWITFHDLEFRVGELTAKPGVRSLRQLLREARLGAHSEAERVVLGALQRYGIHGYRANYRVRVGSHLYFIDIAFPEEKLAIEIDGWAWHSDHEQFQKDRYRQNKIVNAGWTMLRFTWADISTHMDRVAREIEISLQRLSAAT